MEQPKFDASRRIAGFPLKEVKRALGFVGLLDRNDVARIAESLKCSVRQALHVVDELEERGFVTKLERPGRLAATDQGRELIYHWQPPRQYKPIIDREHEEDICNRVFDDAPCGLWREIDETEVTEEARIEAGIFVEQEGERLIEISVAVPDDYDYPEECAHIESTVYLTIAEAKRFTAALQQAIEATEQELARRATGKSEWPKSRRSTKTKAPVPAVVKQTPADDVQEPDKADEEWDERLEWVPSKPRVVFGPRTETKPQKPKLTAEERKRRAAVAATLNELRGKPTSSEKR